MSKIDPEFQKNEKAILRGVSIALQHGQKYIPQRIGKYPKSKSNQDWFHIFTFDYSIGSDSKRLQATNRYFDLYVQTVIGRPTQKALADYFNEPENLEGEVTKRLIVALNKLTDEVSKAINHEVLIDMVLHTHPSMNVHTARRVYPAWFEKWRVKTRERFKKSYLTDADKMAADLDAAMRLANLKDPGRFPWVESVPENKFELDEQSQREVAGWMREQEVERKLKKLSERTI